MVKTKNTLKDKFKALEEVEKKGRKKKASTDGLKQTTLNFKRKQGN